MDIKFAPKVALILGGLHASTNEWGGETSSSDDEAENEVNNNNGARSMLDVARPGDGHVGKVVSAGTGMLLEWTDLFAVGPAYRRNQALSKRYGQDSPYAIEGEAQH